MSAVAQPERATQSRVIGQSRDELEYRYLGRWITRDRLGEKLGKRLGETRAVIVQFMEANPKVTVPELAKQLRLSATAIEKNIHHLRTQRYVKRVGPAKGGHWEVVQ
jgi:predicted HTH transcriptional regulator